MWLIAETNHEVIANSWMQVVAGISSLGFAVWYAWYTTTRTIPEMNKQHSENMQAAIIQFREESKEQRELFERRQSESHELAKLQYDAVGKLSSAISDLRQEIKRH